MVVEEAINNLKKLADCNVINDMMFNINHGRHITIAIKALEKQMPKRRILKDGRYHCPVCGEKINYQGYCKYCGQRCY